MKCTVSITKSEIHYYPVRSNKQHLDNLKRFLNCSENSGDEEDLKSVFNPEFTNDEKAEALIHLVKVHDLTQSEFNQVVLEARKLNNLELNVLINKKQAV